MALKTQGFALSALPTSPKVPDNIGVLDMKAISDGVRRGLETFEAVRRAPQSMILADAQMAAETAKQPLATRQALAQTEGIEQQTPIRTGILAQQAEVARKEAPFKQAQLEFESSPEYLEARRLHLQRTTLAPAGQRSFESLISTFTPDEQAKARRVHAGLVGRASGAAIAYKTIVGPDGREQLVAVDPREPGAVIVGGGQTWGSGVGMGENMPIQSAVPQPVMTSPAPAISSTPEVDELGNPIVVPAQTVAAPVVAAGTAAKPPTPNQFQSPTIQEQKSQAATGTKTAEMVIEAKAKLPKAFSSLERLQNETARIESDIDKAIALTNGWTARYGSLLKNLPGSDAMTLDSILNTIKANVGFDALAEMRQNSPTGGALGNVSDHEGKRLEARIAELRQALDVPVLKERLMQVKEARREALTRARNAYERDIDFFGIEGAPKPQGSSAPAEPTLEDRLKKYQ